jgi:hypothetical protein
MPFATVDAKAVLHAAPATVRSGVVAQAGALPLDAGSQDVLDRAGQAREFTFLKRPCRTKRVELRPPERLVDVDVAEARDCSLIEERSLDRCPAAFQSPREPGRCERAPERLDPESLFEVGLEVFLLEQLPGAESTDIAIRDVRTVVQPDNSTSMWIVGQLSLRRVPKTPSHPEVNQQSPPRLEPDNQILAAAVERRHSLAFEFSGNGSGLERAHEPRIVDVDAVEPPADQVRLELESGRLDFG